MWLSSDSPAGARFFAVLGEGRGLKPSARLAGVSKETARRWVREAFVVLRDDGLSIRSAQERLGFSSSLMPGWDAARAKRGDGRHHLRREIDVERSFWSAFHGGSGIEEASRAAGVGRSTGYRWWQQRFIALREGGTSVRAAARELRLGTVQAAAWEAARAGRRGQLCRAAQAQRVAAVHASAAHAQALLARRSRAKILDRQAAYWALMRQGTSNTVACRILGVSRKTGQLIRARTAHQSRVERAQARWSGRYLSLPERWSSPTCFA